MKKTYLLVFILLISNCARSSFKQEDKSTYRGHYKVGKEYKINNVKYAPKKIRYYEKTGLASWYGPGFHGRKTANGEIFNQRDITAAHRTLPLPCVARIINLENNKSVVVKVNDRGPFARNSPHKRIIDISERAAEILGMKHKGIAKVKVRLMHNATQKLHRNLGLNSIN